MIDARYRRKPLRGMAVLAEARRRNMCDILTCCRDAVVAARAAGFDTEVIEEHWEPARGLVAAIALLLRRRMVRRLANALNIVVTTRATAEDCIVVHLNEREPLARAVAVLAEVRAQHVIRWLGSCEPDAASDLVTAYAFRRRSLKHSAYVTALAISV